MRPNERGRHRDPKSPNFPRRSRAVHPVHALPSPRRRRRPFPPPRRLRPPRPSRRRRPVLAPAPRRCWPPSPPAAPPVVVVAPPPPPASSPVELMSLRLMREKGILSKAEYESAVHDLAETTGEQHARPRAASSWASGRRRSTASSSRTTSGTRPGLQRPRRQRAGARAPIRRRAPTRGTQFSIRNSRFGFRMKAPEVGGVRTSAMARDRLHGHPAPGRQPGLRRRATRNPAGTEATYFTSPSSASGTSTSRSRRRSSTSSPASTGSSSGGVRATSRTPSRSRASRARSTRGRRSFASARRSRPTRSPSSSPSRRSRPVQRDGDDCRTGRPGIRFAVDSWTGAADGRLDGHADLAALDRRQRPVAPRRGRRSFSACAEDDERPDDERARGRRLPAGDSRPRRTTRTTRSRSRASSPRGYGAADMYTGLTGGIAFPALPNPRTPRPGPGLPGRHRQRHRDLRLQGRYSTASSGRRTCSAPQYYLPGVDGQRLGLRQLLAPELGQHALLRHGRPRSALSETWFDVNLFVQPLPALRIGAEYANFNDKYVDGSTPSTTGCSCPASSSSDR